MQPLTAQFKNYLASQTTPRLSPATLKNYVSDVEVFLTWLAKHLQETTVQPVQPIQPIQPIHPIQPIQLTAVVFQKYADFVSAAQNQIHPATAQRYLSSLKRFGEFLKATSRTDSNPAAEIKLTTINLNQNQVINEFRNELIRQKLSPSTIKNYVSDVNHYLQWAKEYLKTTGGDLLQLS